MAEEQIVTEEQYETEVKFYNRYNHGATAMMRPGLVDMMNDLIDNLYETRYEELYHQNAYREVTGRQVSMPSTELPEEIWHKITTLIVDGTFYISKYVAQQMLKQKSGSIILTATTDALIGQAGLDAYTASKGAIISLTRSMAAGLSPEGIRVNAICPGFVETPHQMNFMNDPKIRKELEDLHLMGILKPEDIAEFALFLASDKSRMITGAIHAVDSGYTAFKGKMELFDQITS